MDSMCKTIHEALYYHNSDWLEWFIRAGLDEHEALAPSRIFFWWMTISALTQDWLVFEEQTFFNE